MALRATPDNEKVSIDEGVAGFQNENSRRESDRFMLWWNHPVRKVVGPT